MHPKLQVQLKVGNTIDTWIWRITIIEVDPTVRGMRWMDHKQVQIPPEFPKTYPKSYVMCVYPTGSRSPYKGAPVVTVTVVNTFNYTHFATPIATEIPKEQANFTLPVQMIFSYITDKFVFASE